jgi:PPOX class probable F420-dependent enzyme
MHSEMVARLREARNYWLTTTRPDGRPHAMPVWGVWLDGALWFGTGLESVKGRNLARDPRCLMHLESGDDVVILEGRAERAEDDAAYAAYSEKYDMPADAESFAALPQVGALFRFEPSVAHTWLESSFEDSRATVRL